MNARVASPPAGFETPVVPVRRSRSGRQLIIDACPYCGKRHTHGDGGQRERGWHGHRVAHCRKQPAGMSAGYIIVETSPLISYPCAVPYRRPARPARKKMEQLER
jgi:hypothetical protein